MASIHDFTHDDRQDMKALEDNVERSLLREEKALYETEGTMSDDVVTLQQALRDIKVKYEVRRIHMCYLSPS